MHFELD
jgi:superfamily II DNA helicase RecQ